MVGLGVAVGASSAVAVSEGVWVASGVSEIRITVGSSGSGVSVGGSNAAVSVSGASNVSSTTIVIAAWVSDWSIATVGIGADAGILHPARARIKKKPTNKKVIVRCILFSSRLMGDKYRFLNDSMNDT